MHLSLLIVGANGCPACEHFKPQWDIITEKMPKALSSLGHEMKIHSYKLNNTSRSSFNILPNCMIDLIQFFPFVMLTMEEHFETVCRNNSKKLYGDVLYGISVDSGDTISYFPGTSEEECPNMIYKRDYEGVLNWIREMGIPALERMIRTNKINVGGSPKPIKNNEPVKSNLHNPDASILSIMDIISERYVGFYHYKEIKKGVTLRKRMTAGGSFMF